VELRRNYFIVTLIIRRMVSLNYEIIYVTEDKYRSVRFHDLVVS